MTTRVREAVAATVGTAFATPPSPQHLDLPYPHGFKGSPVQLCARSRKHILCILSRRLVGLFSLLLTTVTHASSRRVYTGGADSLVRLWDPSIDEGQEPPTEVDARDEVTTIAAGVCRVWPLRPPFTKALSFEGRLLVIGKQGWGG